MFLIVMDIDSLSYLLGALFCPCSCILQLCSIFYGRERLNLNSYSLQHCKSWFGNTAMARKIVRLNNTRQNFPIGTLTILAQKPHMD